MSPTKLGDPGEIWYIVFWINLLQNMLTLTFPPHLNNVSTLPCETSNARRARAIPLSWRKNCRFFSLTVASKFARFESFGFQSWKILQGKMVIILITDRDELKQRPRTEWAKLGSCRHCSSLVSGVVDRSRTPDQWCVFIHLLWQYSFIHVYSSKKQYNRSTVKIAVDRTSQAMKHLRLP